jgi:DNA (cytosine-5)-methyltransferase 1
MTNYETTISIPTYVSLCSGYDGIGIGLKRAIPGLRTIAHVEIETYAIANLISKMEAGLLDACPVFTDLKQFPYEQLRDRVTILSAGFPCQPFSSAGKRRATEDERHLYPYIADGITAMRPRYVLLENVEGIISAKTADGESVLKYVLGDLEERGYRCTWGVFSASETGAPHQRKRVFILGKLSDTGCEGLQGDKLGASCDEQVEGLQGSHESASKLHQVRDGQLAHATSGESRQSQTRNGGQDTSGGSEELGDATSFGSCRGCEDSDRIKSEMLGAGLGKTRWPSRPGQQQYEWEQPRVTEAQSCVGLSANGTTFRVDELRLLGNGVVPDCCELAWQTLSNRLHQQI